MLIAQFNDKQFQAENYSNMSLILTVVKPASSAIAKNLAVSSISILGTTQPCSQGNKLNIFNLVLKFKPPSPY